MNRDHKRMELDIGFATDPGPREGINQDSLLAVLPDDSGAALLIVSDGMGGARGGEHASREAVAVIYEQIVGKQTLPTSEEAPERLRAAIVAANQSIFNKARNTPEMEGMGCTVVMALVLGDLFWVASVGDSRAYLVRGERLHQLTDDHTWVNARVREGVLTPDQAATHALRHVLDRALGTRAFVEVDVWPDETLDENDVLVLCSDGLYGVLSEDQIIDATEAGSAQNIADRLLSLALSAPARDNVSVIVMRVVS
jgi:protein phosphatase